MNRKKRRVRRTYRKKRGGDKIQIQINVNPNKKKNSKNLKL